MAASDTLSWTLIARDRASDEFDRVGRRAAAMDKAIATAGVGAGVALAAIGAGAIKMAGDAIQAFADAEVAQARLNFAFAKFPSLAGGNADAIRKLNTELQNRTRFEDDAIAASQMTLAQYDLTQQQLEELTPLMLDYAAATGKDVATAAEDMGKAILGQGRALKAVGVDFEDAGDPVANYQQLLDGLSSKVAGFAEKDAETLSGSLDILKNKWGDLLEQFGEPFAPAVGEISDTLENDVFPMLDEVGPQIEQSVQDALPQIKELLKTAGDALPEAIKLGLDALEGDSKLLEGILKILNGENPFTFSGPDPTDENSLFGGIVQDGKTNGMPGVGMGNGLPAGVDPFTGVDFEQLKADVDEATTHLYDRWDNYAADTKDVLTEHNKDVQVKFDRIGAIMRQAAAAAELAGMDVPRGFARGIDATTWEAEAAAGAMAAAALARAKKTIDSNSPSRAAAKLGVTVPQGFAGGIDEELWRVEESARRMGEAALVGATPVAAHTSMPSGAPVGGTPQPAAASTGPAYFTGTLVLSDSTLLGTIQGEMHQQAERDVLTDKMGKQRNR